MPVVMHEHDQDAHLEHLGAVEQHLGPHHQHGDGPTQGPLPGRSLRPGTAGSRTLDGATPTLASKSTVRT